MSFVLTGLFVENLTRFVCLMNGSSWNQISINDAIVNDGYRGTSINEKQSVLEDADASENLFLW